MPFPPLLWNEFTYTDDNRDFITGNLRLAVDHLMYEHREIALMARDLAMLVEAKKDAEATGAWSGLLTAIREVSNG